MRDLVRIMLLVGLWSFLSTAFGADLEPCQVPRLDLRPVSWMFEDPSGTLSFDQIMDLPEDSFTSITDQSLPTAYSDSAFWLRVTLHNTGPVHCDRWLTVGAPRLTDIQVHIERGHDWQMMVAGVDYPLEQWPVASRLPMFPLALSSYEEVTLLIRVASRSLLLVEPIIWSDQGLLEQRQGAYLADGMILGIVMLIVPFSLGLGWVLHSRLLVSHALSVLSYIVVVCLINGYLIHVPVLLPWSRELIGLFGIITYGLFLSYIRVLLRVHSLPCPWQLLFNVFYVLLITCFVWSFTVDYVQGRDALEIVRQFNYVLIPAALLAGVRRQFEHNWLVWLVCVLFTIQGLAGLLGWWLVPWQRHQEALNLSSTVPGVVLLLCTLMMEISRTRGREKRAVLDLELQQQAEHERLESTVELRTGQLRESLQARSSLMARISHDLRSPLVSIINYARLLQSGVGTDAPRKIERNARQQLELIDELLEFSRTDMHQLELSLAPGYLYGFLREIEEEGGFLASRQNNRFECRLAADLPLLVQADFRRLRQILINLLTNAAKFTHDGMIGLEVLCRVADEQCARLVFSISDSGIGIAADEREQLLQPFWRGRNAKRHDGSGLGLFIVSQLLQHMDSELELDTSTRQGSRFVFEVTLLLAGEEDLEQVVVQTPGQAIDGGGRPILVVDDIEHHRESLIDLLGGYGFDVTAVGSGQAALEQLAEGEFELMISDQMMPGMDAWQLLAQVRAHSPGLPVLLYSAAPPLPTLGTDESLAFDACLLKPASSGQLLTLIGALLEVRIESDHLVP